MNSAGLAGLLTSLAALAAAFGAIYTSRTNARLERAESERARLEAEEAHDLKMRDALQAARLTTRQELEGLIALQREAIHDMDERHDRDIARCRDAAEAQRERIAVLDAQHLEDRARISALERQVRDLGGHP